MLNSGYSHDVIIDNKVSRYCVIRIFVQVEQTFRSSAGEQAGRVVDETAELVGQVSVVFWEEAAHFDIQELFGHFLHDGACRTETENSHMFAHTSCVQLY